MFIYDWLQIIYADINQNYLRTLEAFSTLHITFSSQVQFLRQCVSISMRRKLSRLRSWAHIERGKMGTPPGQEVSVG